MFSYNMEQQALIEVEISDLEQKKKDSFFSVQYGTLHLRGEETWAIFGNSAYRLQTLDYHKNDTLACEFLPVIENNMAIAVWPEEGSGGILHLQRMHMHMSGKPIDSPEWIANYLTCSWLHADELNLSNNEIHNIILGEVAQGKTPLTGNSH